MLRPRDQVRIEGEGGTLDRFNGLNIINDLTAPSEATFELGDDSSWAPLEKLIKHGKTYRVYLNDRLRLTGRIYANEVPVDPRGTSIQLTVRTLLADAKYASADQRVKVESVSIKDFLLALYKQHGYGAGDFVFNANVERDLMTGKGSRGQAPPASLDPIKLDAAKVNPPETTYDCAARHLKRYGLMHWDTPEGKIYVGAPDEGQEPLYVFGIWRSKYLRQGNNLSGVKRIADWSDVPTDVNVFGGGFSKELAGQPNWGTAGYLDVLAAGFNRPVNLLSETAKNKAQAQAQARRERSQRSKRKDALELYADGWSWWNGHVALPYGVNVTCDVTVEVAGGALGKYFIHRVACSQDASSGTKSVLSVTAPGAWEI